MKSRRGRGKTRRSRKTEARKDPMQENGRNQLSSDADVVHHSIHWDRINDEDNEFHQGSGDGDEDIFSEDDDDSDMNCENNPKGLAAKIAAQAKYMQQKFGSGVDEIVDLSEEEDKKSVWGRAKNIYYGDDIDSDSQSSDSDIPTEEAEVRKIQREKAKVLTMADFGLEDLDKCGSCAGGTERTAKDLIGEENSVIRLNSYNGLRTGATETYEVIKKDVDVLSKEEQMPVVRSPPPEVVKLLLELNEAVDEYKTVTTVLPEVCISEGNGTSEWKYSKVKYALLLTYCQFINFYLQLKAEGCLVDHHPVKFHLVELKKMIEKMKQIDALTFQAEDIANSNLLGESVLVPSCGHQLQCESGTADVVQNQSGGLADEITPLSNHSLLNGPDYELPKQKGVQLGLRSNEMLKLRAELEEKLKQKGLCYTTIKSNEAHKNCRKPVNRFLKTPDDIGDEVEQPTIPSGVTGRSSLSKLAQCVVDNKHAKFVSGDDDLPKRDDVGERRRKHELRVLAGAGADSPDGNDGDDNENYGTESFHVNHDLLESENELYEDARRKKNEKLLQKAKLYSRNNEVSSPAFEEASDGKRHITYQMEKNRGLTRARNKLIKNPRKKYKIKYTNATTRRKGQVRDIRKQNGAYGGEATGINIGVSRSVRFKN